MNTSRFALLSRFARSAGLVAVLVASSAGAHAGGGVYWSVNVDAPVQGMGRVSTAVSNTRWGVAPAQQFVYAPAPVVYAPPPVVYVPPAVVVERPVYGYVPAPVVVYDRPRYCEPRGWVGWHHHHHDEDRFAWNDGWRDRAPQMLPAPRDRDDDRGWRRGH